MEITHLDTPAELSNSYTFIRQLGEGSNGKTWLAKDLKAEREVAIKVLKNIDQFKQLDLFKREAETLASIKVDGVPKLYEKLISENSACYLIEEYIPHPSLQTLLDKGKVFGEDETLEIMEAIAKILYKLEMNYRPPIIHRDIKPSNILYQSKANGRIALYLIDFGAVAHPEKRGEGSTIAGTFGYMAPEQYYGEADCRSDYYALGATALHLLCGVSPYEIQATSGSSTGVQNDVFKMDLDRYLPKKTSAAMRTLLSQLISPQPEMRPQDPEALCQAIETCILNKKNVFIRTLKHLPDTIHQFFERNVWITTTARIQGVFPNTLPSVHTWIIGLIDYTFTVKNKLYVGFIEIKKTINVYKELTDDQESAVTLTISYLKSNPSISVPQINGSLYLPSQIYHSVQDLFQSAEKNEKRWDFMAKESLYISKHISRQNEKNNNKQVEKATYISDIYFLHMEKKIQKLKSDVCNRYMDQLRELNSNTDNPSLMKQEFMYKLRHHYLNHIFNILLTKHKLLYHLYQYFKYAFSKYQDELNNLLVDKNIILEINKSVDKFIYKCSFIIDNAELEHSSKYLQNDSQETSLSKPTEETDTIEISFSNSADHPSDKTIDSVSSPSNEISDTNDQLFYTLIRLYEQLCTLLLLFVEKNYNIIKKEFDSPNILYEERSYAASIGRKQNNAHCRKCIELLAEVERSIRDDASGIIQFCKTLYEKSAETVSFDLNNNLTFHLKDSSEICPAYEPFLKIQPSMLDLVSENQSDAVFDILSFSNFCKTIVKYKDCHLNFARLNQLIFSNTDNLK